MNSYLAVILRIIKKEVWLKWRLVTVLYVITSAAFLVAAWYWPRIFTSSSVVLVNTDTILSPLMRGTAVTTEVVDRSRMASQIVLSQQSVSKVLESKFWKEDRTEEYTPKEVELLSDAIRQRTSVESAGTNLIRISFKDPDPQKAYQTAALLTDIFIEDSISGKQAESRSAYEFIDAQVAIYHDKLKSAEQAIQEFRSKNIDASPSAKTNANARLIELKRELESVELELSSAELILEGTRKQLAGESNGENASSLAKETQLNDRVLQLETRLDDLRLNYKETYPDIIQIKGQIESLEAQIANEIKKRAEATQAGKREIPTGNLAQSLRSQLFVTETNIKTLKSKLDQTNALIEKERQTLDSINAVEAEIAELTRDYTVNQDMYQSLLERRENARISMNIDIEKKGSTIQIQEPAVLPQTPRGIRFAHIILVGLIVSFLIPVGVVYGLALLDQKVRSEAVFYEELRLPVLASVYSYETPKGLKKNLVKVAIMAGAVMVVWMSYGYEIFLRLQG